MIIDLHVHTRRYSGCSAIEPEDLILKAAQRGLDGLVLTEHGILWPDDKLAPLRELASTHGLVLLAGQEVTCLDKGTRQDFLVFGLDHSYGAGSSPEDLIKTVHAEGGIVVAAHPFKPSRLGVGYHGAGELIHSLDLDGVETLHPDHDDQARQKAADAAKNRGIPATGGSDAHDLFQVGVYATRFEKSVTTIQELIEQIRSGNVLPVNGAGRI
jgi:predicted metal-dependent phosphoesterase TrpH